MQRILIIDDEKLARAALRTVLERAGFEVVEAGNGREGLLKARETPCDLIITDIIMPDTEGIETILAAKREMPDRPVIAVSGGGRTDVVDLHTICEDLGADRFLAKPFRREELLDAVQALLGKGSK